MLKPYSDQFNKIVFALNFFPVKSFQSLEWLASEYIDTFLIDLYGSGSREWILLPNNIFGNSAWIKISSRDFTDAFYYDTESIKERLISLPSLPIYQDPGKKYINAGHCLVESITDQYIIIRPEIASDMFPEENEKNPVLKPDSVRIKRDSLYNDLGQPLFMLAYPKGC